MYTIKYQSWTKDDLLIFRDKIHELLHWIETYINERYDARINENQFALSRESCNIAS